MRLMRLSEAILRLYLRFSSLAKKNNNNNSFFKKSFFSLELEFNLSNLQHLTEKHQQSCPWLRVMNSTSGLVCPHRKPGLAALGHIE